MDSNGDDGWKRNGDGKTVGLNSGSATLMIRSWFAYPITLA